MRVRAAAATDIGLVREANEDSYLLEDPLFAVADGMGGHRGGEVASRLAVETLEALFKRGADEGVLSEQVQEANRAVFERSMVDRAVAGMGTTLTVALVEGDRARIAHVGDSRAYLLREGRLRMLTEDHTMVHRMVQQGEISEYEAERHPQRSVLTRAIGVDASVTVDEATLDLAIGDRLLLCSDGLTGMLTDEQVAAVLSAEPDTQRAAEALVRAANAGGGFDNTTVVLLDVLPDDADPTPTGAAHVDRGASSAGQSPPNPRSTSPPTLPAVAGSRSGAWDGPASGGNRPPPSRPIHWLRVGVVAAGAVLVLIAGVVGLRTYLHSQWYVGVANGHVALYQGIPATVLSIDLHHVVVETTIPAAEAERLAVFRNLADGITVDDRAAADEVVAQIRKDLALDSPPSSKNGNTGT